MPLLAAEAVVGDLRARLDRSAGWGVPAHVTLLYPFRNPDRIDDRARAALAAAVAGVPAFALTLTRTAWFGDNVLWLLPEPDQPFRDLTAALHQRFPDCPPYGGEHPELVPHLTIGHDVPVEVLRAAERAVRPRLPIRTTVTVARLMQEGATDGRWHTVADYPLGVAVRPG